MPARPVQLALVNGQPPNRAQRRKTQPIPQHLVTEEWIDQMVQTADETVKLIVTADVSGWLLKYNTNNRPLHEKAVAEHGNALIEGRQINTREPVIISDQCVLVEGQHRLNAVLRTGIPAELNICFGSPHEARDRTGIGMKRSAADELGQEGYAHPGMSAAISKGLYWHLRGQSTSKSGLPTDLVKATIRQHPFIVEIATVLRNSKFAPIRKSWCGVVLAIIRLTNSQEKVEKFIDHISRRVGDEDDPAVRLHVRLTNISASRRKETLAQQMAAFMHAWNAWVDDRRIKRLQGVTKGDERKTALIPAALIARPDR